MARKYEVSKEQLGDGAELTSFTFHHGANLYVFSCWQQDGMKHTLIDAGDPGQRHSILSLLKTNGIVPANIERIIITHRHADHCGALDILAKESGASILVRAEFKSFVEGTGTPEERRWWGEFNPASLRDYRLVYLPSNQPASTRKINGLDFVRLGKLLEIGKTGSLELLAPPADDPTHSPDQIVVLYSPRTLDGPSRPADQILFAGDLWLMRGPIYERNFRNLVRHVRYRVLRLKGRDNSHHDPREQDAEAKEALKKGFSIIRVKPGHGEEFLGTKLVPAGLLASRDLLMELGYPIDASKSILRSPEVDPKVAQVLEKAYRSFLLELEEWCASGYTPEEAAGLLARVYREQSDGGPVVAIDRKERRARIKETLSRLKEDRSQPPELRHIAEFTLHKIPQK